MVLCSYLRHLVLSLGREGTGWEKRVIPVKNCQAEWLRSAFDCWWLVLPHARVCKLAEVLVPVLDMLSALLHLKRWTSFPNRRRLTIIVNLFHHNRVSSRGEHSKVTISSSRNFWLLGTHGVITNTIFRVVFFIGLTAPTITLNEVAIVEASAIIIAIIIRFKVDSWFIITILYLLKDPLKMPFEFWLSGCCRCSGDLLNLFWFATTTPAIVPVYTTCSLSFFILTHRRGKLIPQIELCRLLLTARYGIKLLWARHQSIIFNHVLRVQFGEVWRVLWIQKEHIWVACALSAIRDLLRIDAHSSIVAMPVLFICFHTKLRGL